MVAVVFLIASGLAQFCFSLKNSASAPRDYTAEVHPREGDGGVTYEC
jgi:hypothetical protein